MALIWDYDGVMYKKEQAKIKSMSLRIPNSLYTRIEVINKLKPHLSMNALIVELLEKSLVAQANKGDSHS